MSTSRHWLVIAAVVIAFAAKMGLAVATYGTNDALTWEADLTKIRSEGGLAVYRDGVIPRYGGKTYIAQLFSHPPFMIRAISAWGWIADVTGVPMRFWIRLTCSLADVVSVVLLLRMLNPFRGLSPLSVFLVVLSPISILISGFHVNTDPIMVSFVLLSIYLIQRGSPALVAGCAMGMALNIKIVPVLFIPAVCLYLRGWKKIMAFALGTGLIVAAGSMPEILQDPLLIWNRLSGYSSNGHVWGFSFLAVTLLPDSIYTGYPQSMKAIMLLSLVGVSVWMNVRKSVSLVLQLACVAFILLSLIPGFGVQYLAWLVPWTVLLSGRQSILFHASSGLFLLGFYHRASQGLWYLANTLDIRTPLWGGSVGFLGVSLWLVICATTFALAMRIWIDQCEQSTAPVSGRSHGNVSFFLHVTLLVTMGWILGWAGGYYFSRS